MNFEILEKLKNNFVYLNKEYVEGEVYTSYLDFNIKNTQEIKSAKAYITALGMYDFLFNNQKIDKQFFKPGYQTYSKRVCYQTFDLKKYLKENNLIKFYIGQGWYCGRFFCENTVQNYGELPAFSCVIDLKFNDDHHEFITTSPSMKAYYSEYKYAGEYDGETIDFSSENIEKPYGMLTLFNFNKQINLEETLTKVTLQEEIKNFEVKEIAPQKYIIDFKQNFAGVISVDLSKLQNNETITIRHGEILNSDGSLYTQNLRKAKATLQITKKDNNEIYTPRFTYMGFRYIEISGVNYVDGLISAHPLHSEMERLGYFNSDNEKINRLFLNQLWSQRSNYVEIPTDCPQRDERLGYTGDGHVFALTGTYNYNTLDFFTNFFKDLRLSQDMNKDGNVPPYLPQAKEKCVGFMTMQGWGNAVTIIPEIMYQQYNNFDFLVDNYEAMKKYVDLELLKAGKKHLWNAISLGDWLSLNKGIAWQAMNNHPVSNAFLVNDLRIITKVSKLLNKEHDYKYYSEQYKLVKKAYIKAFVKKNGKVTKDYQGTYVLALKHVLTKDDPIYNLVAQKFIENVKKNGLSTGFFGTEHLLPLLCDLNETKLAYDILFSEKCPGWFNQINHGATTIWERWDAIKEDGKVNESNVTTDNMVSFNHYSFGAVGEFYYQYILGIKPLEPGFKEILIHPYFDKRLSNVEGSYKTISGLISISYQFIGKKINVKIKTPSKTTIILNNQTYHVLPGEYQYTVEE